MFNMALSAFLGLMAAGMALLSLLHQGDSGVRVAIVSVSSALLSIVFALHGIYQKGKE